MPVLSIVLVVHGEQAFIEECAASVLGQEGSADVELLAIDDASPDHGPELLDGLAERDPRVRVEHLEERVGLGAARNMGLERASGDYVWFVGTTDRIPPGALAKVLGRLRETAADLLIVHHARLGALGREHPGPHLTTLAEAARERPASLADRPALAQLAPRAWNKVFRRELIADVRFGPAGHGELTVTWPALLRAGRIAVLAEKSYERRRPANATPEPGGPFDVFGQYDAVLELAGERAQLVAPAMLRQLRSLLDSVPDAQRREFFHRMSGYWSRHGATGGTAKLIAADRYAAFRALEEARDARRTLGRGRRALRTKASSAKRRRRRRALDRHYAGQLKKPIDPDLAVFAAYWYAGYRCNPRAIYEKARELVPGMRGVWVVKREAVDSLPAGVEHVVAGTPEYYDTIARARYFVNNVNFPNHLVKREGAVHVMTHHGTPLKKMGLDQQQSAVAGERMNFAALLRRCARWDYSVSSNVFSTLVWEHAYPLRYESIESGYPRNDVLSTATDDDVRRIREELGIEPGQTAVLYAPTHREYLDGYVPVLDARSVAGQLGAGHVVLARAHYFYENAAQIHGGVRDVSAHPSVEELMLAADVLVTDYSSIMFDYGVLDRPIVIHAPDWDAYRRLRGTYFDLMEAPPGPVTRTESEVVAAIRAGDSAADARGAFRERFCSLEDGNAAERVVRRVWFGEREPADKPVPAVVG
jgi:CDP-glycerol glycerophosphotransferase